MSQTPKIYDHPFWEDPVRTDFLGPNPVQFVNSEGVWKACPHAHSLSSACLVIANSIFDEEDRNKDVKCTICRKKFTEMIRYNDICESKFTVTETVVNEQIVVTTTLKLEDGRESIVLGKLSEKVGYDFEGSKVKEIQEESLYVGTVETSYEYYMPKKEDTNEYELVHQKTQSKTYKSRTPYDVKPKVIISYDKALQAWKTDRDEAQQQLADKTTDTARPVLQEVWETQECAPLVAALIEEFKGEGRERGQFQLDMKNARIIRDKIRQERGLPLGYEPEALPLPRDVKPLRSSTSSDSSPGSADEAQCCLAQLGGYNLVIASMVASLLVIYGYSKGVFDNLIQNLRGSDDQSMRQKTTVPIHQGPPATPYNPGGLGGITVYG